MTRPSRGRFLFIIVAYCGFVLHRDICCRYPCIDNGVCGVCRKGVRFCSGVKSHRTWIFLQCLVVYKYGSTDSWKMDCRQFVICERKKVAKTVALQKLLYQKAL